MKIGNKDLANISMPSGRVRKITYADGSTAYVFKKCGTDWQSNPTRRHSFPFVNRNEPMTKVSYRRTLNRNFEKLLELDLINERCFFLTLTIRNEQFNTYEKICHRFKAFTNKVRFSKAVGNSYVGAVRFIEVQKKGFFHVHCILVFATTDIKLTWKDLYKMWGWGFVKVKPIDDFIGLIDYLTNIKFGVLSEQNDEFTRYPKGAKVIYISPNLPKANSESIDMPAEKFAALICNEQSIGHFKGHKYFDQETRSVRLAIDKMVLVQILEKRRLRK